MELLNEKLQDLVDRLESLEYMQLPFDDKGVAIEDKEIREKEFENNLKNIEKLIVKLDKAIDKAESQFQ